MTTRRERTFKIGQRVRLTAVGIEYGIARRGVTTGRVIGWRRPLRACDGPLIRVLRDGRKTVEVYHADFWEPIARAAAERKQDG